MKTKSLLIYNITGKSTLHSYNSTKRSSLHLFVAFSLLVSIVLLSYAPFRVHASQANGISDVSIGTVTDITEEATSPNGASVTFSLPSADEYTSSTDTTTPLTATCDHASGDTFALGTTTVTCMATGTVDSSLSAQSSFSVVVRDTTAPVLTLNGSSSLSLVEGDVFTDEGATASDTVSGDLTSRISVTGSVDTATIGDYSLVYSVLDDAHNSASATRNIHVISSSSSQIASSSPSASSTPSVPDPSATSTPPVSNASSSDVTAPTGPLTLTSSTHSENATTTASDITLTWDSASDDVELVGYRYAFDASATSTPDGSATTTSNGITETLTAGTWYFHVASYDTSGNVGVPLHFGPIIIESNGGGAPAPDVTAPTGLSLVTGSVAEHATSSTYAVTMSWNDATDTSPFGYSYIFDHASSTDPDAVTDTSATSTTETLTEGTWYFHVRAVDSSANAGQTVTYGPFSVFVSDVSVPSAPSATLSLDGTHEVSLSWTGASDDRGVAGYKYIFSTSTNPIPDTLVSSSTLSASTTLPDGRWRGYVLAYDEAGNESTIAASNLAIIDTAGPVITLLGPASTTITTADSYTDPGVTVIDAIEGDASQRLSISGSADTQVPGDYTITYSAVDWLSNPSVSVSRVVHVVLPPDVTAPVLTLNGSSTESVFLGSSFVEQGASASDDRDGDITSHIAVTGSVDTSILGDYTLSYAVSDTAGNTAVPVTRTVHVVLPPDVTAPTIGTLSLSQTGSSTLSLSWIGASDDRGVTDYYYGVSTSSSALPDTFISASSTSVSVTVSDGLWYATLLAYDGAGNASAVASATPVRIDTVKPVITLSSGDASLFTGDTFTEPGYSAHDDIDGDVTSQVTVSGSPVMAVAGDYMLAYSVTDSHGNTSLPVSRTVHVVSDIEVPLVPSVSLSKVGTSTLSLSWGAGTDNRGLGSYSYTFSQSTSTIPSTVLASTTTSVSQSVIDGVWYGIVSATDVSGNVSSRLVSNSVTVDTTAPVLTLTGSASTSVYLDSSYSDAGATALDAIDGDITSHITVTGSVDTSILGDYTLSYAVSDTAGNTAVPVTRTVHVVLPPDVVAPVLIINGSSTASVYQGRSYTELSATAHDERDGDVTAHIVTTGSVDTSVIGSYQVTYSVSDSAGNASSSTRIVNVIPLVYYTVTQTVDSGKGSFTGSSSSEVAINDTYSTSFVPNHGYEVSSLLVDGVSVATSTTLSLTDVTASHGIHVSFAPRADRNVYPVVVSMTGRGSVVASSSVFEGEDYTAQFVPGHLRDVSSLVVDGNAVATSSMVSFTNASTSHTIAVTFSPTVVDSTPPSAPITAGTSIPVTTIADTHQIDVSWLPATDNLSGVEGYSYALDQNATTTPDDVIDATSTSASYQSLPYGTYYFHIKSIDYLGNVSATSHTGPFLFSDGNVLVEESTIGGVYEVVSAPTRATLAVYGISGTSSVSYSTYDASSTLASSTLVRSTVATSQIDMSTVATSTTSFSQVSRSVLMDSLVSQSSLTRATSTRVTADDVTITDSTLSDVTATSSQIVRSFLSQNSIVGSSSVRYVNATSAVIYNNKALAGTFTLPTGDTFTVTEERKLSDVVEDAPTASLTTFQHEYSGIFADASHDLDEHEGVFADRWHVTISYGDGTASSTHTSVLGEKTYFVHQYASPGDYTITYTVTDLYGLSSTYSTVYHLADPYGFISWRGSGAKTETEESATAKRSLMALPSSLSPTLSQENGEVKTEKTEVQLSKDVVKETMEQKKADTAKVVTRAITKSVKGSSKSAKTSTASKNTSTTVTTVKKSNVEALLSHTAASFIPKAEAESIYLPKATEEKRVDSITKSVRTFFGSMFSWLR